LIITALSLSIVGFNHNRFVSPSHSQYPLPFLDKEDVDSDIVGYFHISRHASIRHSSWQKRERETRLNFLF